MKRSLNEIEGELRKAIKGAGFPVGLAEDCARAGALLVRFGHDGAGETLKAISVGFSGPSSHSGGSTFSRVQCASQGASVLDLVADGGKDAEASIESLDHPLFFVGLAANAARQFAMAFSIQFDDGVAIRATPDAIENSGDVPTRSCSAIVRSSPFAPPTDKLVAEAGTHFAGYEVNEDAWQQLRILSAKTYVPASEASRTLGAGAAINDND